MNLCCAVSVWLRSIDFVSGSKIKILKQISTNIFFKYHYILIGKYIFVIFLSLFAIRSFRGMGSEGGPRPPQDFEIWHFPITFFEGCFVFEQWNLNFATFSSPATIFLALPWKIHYWPLPGKKISGAQFRGSCSSIGMLKGYMDRESLRTPALDQRCTTWGRTRPR